MLLRLFDRLSRLIRVRPRSRDAGRDTKRESQAGGHRKGARSPSRAPARQRPATSLAASSGRASVEGIWLDYASASSQGRSGMAGRAGRPDGGIDGGIGGRGVGGGGAGRARIQKTPFGSAPVESLAHEAPAAARDRPAVPRQPWYQVVPPAARQAPSPARPLDGTPPPLAHEVSRGARPTDLPFVAPHPNGVRSADGRTNCGPIERILWRQWEETRTPPPQAVAAVERLAGLPRALQEKLADGLDGIYVGAGGVPELDHMTEFRGVPLPSGRATWDACAGAYGERKIVVGTRPSPTPDVMCHEVGHALDDLDSPPGTWQSDSPAFRLVYDECQAYIVSDFHRQRGGLGRKEFFADAFAAIASGQRPALVDMLDGNTRCALKVMLYFNRRYGI